MIREILYPSSVAIIGASAKPGRIGYQLLKNVIDHGFKGRIYPVNPNEKEIMGLRCYPTIEEISDSIDTACVVLPAKAVLDVVRQAARKGVRGLVIYSSGFAESGPEGEDYQREVIAAARAGGTRIIGPNTNGFFNGDVDLHLTFNPVKTMKGEIAVITQSGGMMSGFVFESIREGVPVSKFVNLENKGDVNEIELLELFAEDENTRAIFMYLESITDPEEFVRVSRRVSRSKPIVGYKAGIGESGGRIISMHTGSKPANMDVEELFREAGVMRVWGLSEAIDTLKALTYLHPPSGNRIGFVTNTAGIAAVMADICERRGLSVPRFSDGLAERVRRALPPGLGYPYNPVDTTANTSYDVMKGALTELIESDEVDIVVAGGIRSAFIPHDHFERAWSEASQLAKERGKPFLGVMMGDDGIFDSIINKLRVSRVPVYTMPERAALSLVHLYEYSMIRQGKL